MTIKEAWDRGLIRVGAIVKTCDGPRKIEGYIGEITDNCFYIWHNEPKNAGGTGTKHREQNKYNHSWLIEKKNINQITFGEIPETCETCKLPLCEETEKWIENQCHKKHNSISLCNLPTPIKPTTTPKTIIMNAIKFISRIGMSEENKALVDMGLEDPSGVPTQEGKDAMFTLLYNENREKLSKVAMDMVAEQKEKKA